MFLPVGGSVAVPRCDDSDRAAVALPETMGDEKGTAHHASSSGTGVVSDGSATHAAVQPWPPSFSPVHELEVLSRSRSTSVALVGLPPTVLLDAVAVGRDQVVVVQKNPPLVFEIDTNELHRALERGRVGEARAKPVRLPLRLPVTLVACGMSHAAVVSSARLYTWGANQCGQTGLGHTAYVLPAPCSCREAQRHSQRAITAHASPVPLFGVLVRWTWMAVQ